VLFSSAQGRELEVEEERKRAVLMAPNQAVLMEQRNHLVQMETSPFVQMVLF